jgi:DNA-binding NarL/FixJ family response regulator
MSPASRIRIVVADDHFIVRTGLLSLLHTEPSFTVVGQAADGDEAIRVFEQHRPDLMLVDLLLPGKTGHEVTRHIRRVSPGARILMLSAYDGDADIQAALEAGVDGYVFKSATGEELIPAIHAVAAGRRWIPQDVAARLKLGSTFEPLTGRELEVLGQLARGQANKEIADTLGISEHTTKGHLKSILGKLRVADRTQAVIAAVQRGLIHY